MVHRKAFIAAFPPTAPRPPEESRPATAPPAWAETARAAASGESAPESSTAAPGWPPRPARPPVPQAIENAAHKRRLQRRRWRGAAWADEGAAQLFFDAAVEGDHPQAAVFAEQRPHQRASQRLPRGLDQQHRILGRGARCRAGSRESSADRGSKPVRAAAAAELSALRPGSAVFGTSSSTSLGWLSASGRAGAWSSCRVSSS